MLNTVFMLSAQMLTKVKTFNFLRVLMKILISTKFYLHHYYQLVFLVLTLYIL